MILYEGPSLLNGEPIVAIATGIHRPSTNRKTGPMIQTWILHRDLPPTAAVKSGRDEAICGSCPARGQWCYVQVGQGPNRVWRTYREGGYASLDLGAFRNRAVRIGSYGDPAAVPTHIWQRLVSTSSIWSGYTHSWRECDQALKLILMASVDSIQDYEAAKRMGWRCFRVSESISDRLKNEARCPYPATGLRCIDCRYCNGQTSNRKGDVIVAVHGPRNGRFLHPTSAM